MIEKSRLSYIAEQASENNIYAYGLVTLHGLSKPGQVYGNEGSKRSHVSEWFKLFQNGLEDVKNDSRLR
ncbi:hypothetical protein TNCV_2803151 [Trichonephila clavipes]|nr:hypothetical protein TNCV_2803151 [Trichonephila clavipes]